MKDQIAKEILDRYLAGKSSIEEQALVETWYLDLGDKQEVNAPIDYDFRYQQLLATLPGPKKTQVIPLWSRLIAAAIALIVIGAGLFYYQAQDPKRGLHAMANYANDIAPGKVGATLTLANGKKIRLSDAANGQIAKQAGISVIKTADGQITYKIEESSSNNNQVNTLSTAVGETYSLILPDQSKVWLNAASSLTYAAGLQQQGQRRVKLVGEAYFQVAKDALHPFVVESGSQQVEVLGTEFNVNSYQDEEVFRTTLLQGSVKLSDNGATRILSPGDQATNAKGQLHLATVDTELAVAWKNNKFIFERLHIEEIMRMISRWYNVEVIYQGEVPDVTFWGSVSRFENVSKALISLEATGNVHFKIEGRKIYVFM
ncbi:FecR family protein [Pedobacter metabolipauper]|uniref:FecR family protein n=1 Tax=Pedobacter metabolipauper TaxID=425513 RepID=A0A4R6SUT1_9SPHI|nr:FecR family protein [Pedobacter metabolipauper]TDQ07497.1 FecR family protein [Pedobacter metabolipauper]